MLKNDHSLIHAAKVCVLCAVLAEELGLDIKETLYLMFAAVVHDTGRENNSKDTEHGVRSTWNLIYSMDEVVYDIVRNHSRADRRMGYFDEDRNKFLTKVFKDADALDRVRTGDLDESKLRFNESKKLIEFARRLHECLLTAQD